MIYVLTTYHLRPGRLEAFVAPAYVLIDTARRSEGCLYFDLHASVTDPDRALCLERWADAQALAKSLESEARAVFGRASANYVLSSRTEIIHPDRVESV